MKISDLSSKKRSSYHWINFAAASLLVAALAGCGGGDGGDTTAAAPATPATPAAPAAPTVAAPTGTAPVTLTAATAAATLPTLKPIVTVGGVSIASPPVVTFAIADGAATNNPVVGLGFTKFGGTCTTSSRSTNAPKEPLLTNMAFSLAKLVPGTNGSPSKWVSYIVASPEVYTSATDLTVIPRAPGRPSTESNGTLKDNGDGTYTYTFFNDITKMADLVASLTDATGSSKADLGDLTYEPTLTHRLTIQIGGTAFGTGSVTADCSASGVTAAPMLHPVNAIYDFIPATGQAVTATDTARDIVATAKCNECHNKLGGIPGPGFHEGIRYETKFCVVCHTEQRKYGRSNVASAAGAFAAAQYVADGETLGDFPILVHKIHFGSTLAGGKTLTKTGYSYAGVAFNDLVYPQSVGNCTKCHDGTAAATNATLQGDNYKAAPSRKACGACHDGIVWATGTGKTLNLKPTGSTVNTNGHVGGAHTDDSQCGICHKVVSVAAYHSDTIDQRADATKRTMSAEITGVAVDVVPADKTKTMATTTTTGTGSVTVTFKLTDAGVPVTGLYDTAWSGLAFTFAKLNPAENGASTNWQSYTLTARTSDPAKPPVPQGYSESANKANLTHTGGGVWTYKFTFARTSTVASNASVAGDIRTLFQANNRSSTSGSSGVTVPPYSAAVLPYLPGGTLTDTTPYTISYDWWKTHRVAMAFSKGTGATNNKFNAVYDFVPLADSARPAQTRNIVSMDTCATCHNGVRLHSRYTVEMCVTCHNKNTGDPFTGALNTAGTGVTFTSVDLQRIVHKLHMGADLPSVQAGGALYRINHQEFSGRYPGIIQDCAVCHSSTAKKPNGTTVLENASNWSTTATSIACGSCHDSASAVAHISDNVNATTGAESCGTCHKSGSAFGLDIAGLHKLK